VWREIRMSILSFGPCSRRATSSLLMLPKRSKPKVSQRLERQLLLKPSADSEMPFVASDKTLPLFEHSKGQDKDACGSLLQVRSRESTPIPSNCFATSIAERTQLTSALHNSWETHFTTVYQDFRFDHVLVHRGLPNEPNSSSSFHLPVFGRRSSRFALTCNPLEHPPPRHIPPRHRRRR
jgi:hypothetical protein